MLLLGVWAAMGMPEARLALPMETSGRAGSFGPGSLLVGVCPCLQRASRRLRRGRAGQQPLQYSVLVGCWGEPQCVSVEEQSNSLGAALQARTWRPGKF